MAEISKLNGYDIKDKKAIRTYDTIADMLVDETLKDGQSVSTLGYYNINDGGGAEYKITDTSSLSEYQEELENGLYATLLIKDSKINVLKAGITSSNSINYTSKIQTLIDLAQSKGISVEFNPIDYYVSALNFKCDIDGRGCTFKVGYFSVSNVVAINYSVDNLVCENYIVDAQNFGSTANLRTDARNIKNLTLRKVEMKNFIHSSNNAWGLLVTKSHDIKLIECKGNNCSQSTVAIVEDSSVIIDKCKLEKINIEPNSDEYLVDVNINDSTIDIFTIVGNSRTTMYITVNIVNSIIDNFIPRTCVLNMINTQINQLTTYDNYSAGSIRGNIENCFEKGLELNANPLFKDVFNGSTIDTSKGYRLNYSPLGLNVNMANQVVSGIGTLLTLNPNKNSYITLKTDKYAIDVDKNYMVKLKYIAESNASNGNVGQLMRVHFHQYDSDTDTYTELSSKTYFSGYTRVNENTDIQTDYLIVQPPENATHIEVKFGASGGNCSAKYQLIELNFCQINLKKINLTIN